MGDRTSVRIELRKSDFEKLLLQREETLEQLNDEINYDDVGNNHPKTITFYANDRDNANWEELEEILIEHQIEFTKSWDSGDNFGPGTEYFRLNEEDCLISIERSEIDDEKLSMLTKYKSLIEQDNLEELKKAILEEHYLLAPIEIRSLREENSVRFIKDK